MALSEESITGQPYNSSEKLEGFVSTANNNGLVNAIVERNLRVPDTVDISFSVIPIIGSGRHRHTEFGEPENKQRKFFTDGENGLLLMGQSYGENSIALAEVSFSEDQLRSLDGIKDFDTRIYPRILQMQGCTYEGDRRARRTQVLNLLGKFRMEQVLLELIIQYAKLHGMPAVAIIPAENNPNREKAGFNMNVMKARYNGTARKNKFKKQENGLYLKDLDTH